MKKKVNGKTMSLNDKTIFGIIKSVKNDKVKQLPESSTAGENKKLVKPSSNKPKNLSRKQPDFHKTKAFDDFMQSRVNSSKVVNDNMFLKEKVKSLQNILEMKNKELQIMQSKYNSIFEDYQTELQKFRNRKNEASKQAESLISNSKLIKSIVKVFLDIIETFIAAKPINTARESVSKVNADNTSYSLDIYESYFHDDDRKNALLEQIQNLLISKLKFMASSFRVDFEKEISQVKSWNSNKNQDVSLKSLKISFKKDQDSYSSGSCNKHSREIELSTSNYQSPKFLNRLSEISLIENKLDTAAKEENTINFNESFLNVGNFVFDEGSHKHSFANNNHNNSFDNIKNLKIPTLNDKLTEFNLEYCTRDENTNNIEGQNGGPKILSPIFLNTHNPNNISFNENEK